MKIREVGKYVTRGRGLLTAALILGVSLWAATAQSQTIVGNNSACGGGPIDSFDFATGTLLNSFVPAGALAGACNNGRGLLVLNGNVYYTELTSGFGPTDSIRVAAYNAGAGGTTDIRTIPNPRPTTGIQDLAFANGLIYALTGYPYDPPQVFALNPITGAVVSGPVSIASPASGVSDGFVVLPNGNFLINVDTGGPYGADASCTYNQFNPSTGALTADPPIIVAGPGPDALCSTGVDTDGTHLYFQVGFNSFTRTDLTGGSAVNHAVAANSVEDISLLHVDFTLLGTGGTPGQASCHGNVVSYLSNTYGTLANAVIALGYPSTMALQNAINGFCGG